MLSCVDHQSQYAAYLELPAPNLLAEVVSQLSPVLATLDTQSSSPSRRTRQKTSALSDDDDDGEPAIPTSDEMSPSAMASVLFPLLSLVFPECPLPTLQRIIDTVVPDVL